MLEHRPDIDIDIAIAIALCDKQETSTHKAGGWTLGIGCLQKLTTKNTENFITISSIFFIKNSERASYEKL